jgi:hypothetical protein
MLKPSESVSDVLRARGEHKAVSIQDEEKMLGNRQESTFHIVLDPEGNPRIMVCSESE